MTNGIHHITAISSDPQRTYDFYAGVLGLRLLKKSVNQDDRGTYHLFFGDEAGSPGMDLTFFPYEGAKPGMAGSGMVQTIMLSVPTTSLQFWKEHLTSHSISYVADKNQLLDEYIEFKDWDGQRLQIVGSKRLNKKAKPWVTNSIMAKNAIHNFYGAELLLESAETSLEVVTNILGFKQIFSDSDVQIYENASSDFANLLFIKEAVKYAVNGAGTVHHIAFRVNSDAQQQKVLAELKKQGQNPTEVIDRYYFKSVYFREPGGILFEIATDEPGFSVDEDAKSLGEKLALPPFIEQQRGAIEAQLTPIQTNREVLSESKLLSLFKFIEVDNAKAKTIFLLHGTGADERDLLQILPHNYADNYNVVSLRGNVSENGMLRFFMRYDIGNYDQASIAAESKNLSEFIEIYCKSRAIKPSNISYLGYSNGANMVFAASAVYPQLFQNMALLHPAMVLAAPLSKPKYNKGTKALVTYGAHDQMITAAESKDVIDFLQLNSVEVTTFDNGAGHGITKDELDVVYEWLV